MSEQLEIPGFGNDRMEQIVNAAILLGKLQEEAAELAAKTVENAKRMKELEERTIPMLMSDLHLRELRLTSGKKIAVGDVYYASVPAARMNEVHAWLKARNMEAIVTDELVVSPENQSILIEKAIPFEHSRSIHSSRLRAFVKEQMTGEQATQFPQELFGVSVVTKATIK